MIFECVILIVVTVYLRKTLHTSVSMPEWNRLLLLTMYAAIGLITIQFSFPQVKLISKWLAMIMLAGVMYVLYSNEKFKQAKIILVAVLPYLLVSFFIETIRLISSSLYNEWEPWLEGASTFTGIWAFGTWIVTNRQQKELVKVRKKVIEEEENNKVIAAMKAQLEIEVAERTAELTKQKEELELALNELKTTQTQLIQSEKMASLGELTAGIAHEIQNPLNFVNNFSEVNTELIDEMMEEVDKGNAAEIKLIAGDIKQNLEKINHHGKRADAIVKGMLQHSRSSSATKEPTDINKLADEYFRLAYHGLRAKDKSFNAAMKADYDETIGDINIIPQDIGRVILNLITNAFYAVDEKRKALVQNVSRDLDGSGVYEPTVCVSTKRTGKRVEIKVEDNGNGIPKNVVDKIFQPFFTTKPSGQGTGLGLSMSYDIVTKGHGGTLKVETIEGKGSLFIIGLPV